ncbi:MAG: bifunctional hydroxymethylpyrimidine kinase/phosphomethylpyrimidine kinase, partial [Caulobacteraceae bacterium]|nr:bifunctional hydroxymethylpyrimidine kinase/phosphomethylpyrimidine kinase [Caulobacteraceae bacterium]
MGIDTMLVPTVLFGRHPGLGAPGGGPVGIEIFEGMLAGVEAAGVFGRLDAAVTGYFACPAQIAAAARALDAIRALNAKAWVIVDPIMGDEGVGFYVPEAVADALAADLVPRADLVAPNAWELERLTGRMVSDPATALDAARSLGRPVLASSVEVGTNIGVLYADAGQAWLASHPRQADAPRGTGDRLTALFAGAVLGGD